MPGGSVAVVTAMVGTALLFVTASTATAPVSESFRVGTALLFVTAFGAVLLADLERITRGVAVAAVLVVAGAALITLGCVPSAESD